MFGASQSVKYSCDANANRWIEKLLGDCVYTTWDTIGFVIGLSSVWFWLIAQLPQFISNFMRRAADALSPWFLAQWLLGDSFNFLGCILTGDQLKTQIITAGYFIFSDIVIISQYVYYQIQNRKVLYLDDSVHKGSSCSSVLKGAHSWQATCDESSFQKISTFSDSMQADTVSTSATLSDIHQHDSWIYKHRYHLRRLALEYNLEYGQSMAKRLTVLYNNRKERCTNGLSRKDVANSISTKRVPYKPVLGIMGILGMVSIPKSRLFSRPCISQCMKGGTVSNRRALLALGSGAVAEQKFAFTGTDQPGSVYHAAHLLSLSQQTYQWAHVIGGLFGWFSSALYLGSRVSQLIKNKQRRSVEGLSLGMVTCAILANLTYGVSIIMRSASWHDLINKAPWLLGSCGTVFLDLSILIQAHYYSSQCCKGKAKEYMPLLS